MNEDQECLFNGIPPHGLIVSLIDQKELTNEIRFKIQELSLIFSSGQNALGKNDMAAVGRLEKDYEKKLDVLKTELKINLDLNNVVVFELKLKGFKDSVTYHKYRKEFDTEELEVFNKVFIKQV